MAFRTSSAEFSMIFLKLSEIFHDNFGGKDRAEGTICNDRRAGPGQSLMGV